LSDIKGLHGHCAIYPVIPAEAGIQGFANTSQAEDWILAFARMTLWLTDRLLFPDYALLRECGVCFAQSKREYVALKAG